MRNYFLLERVPSPAAERVGLQRWVRWICRSIGLAIQVSRERQALAHLSPEQLTDVGITASAADLETQRAFFDIPPHRRSRLYL